MPRLAPASGRRGRRTREDGNLGRPSSSLCQLLSAHSSRRAHPAYCQRPEVSSLRNTGHWPRTTALPFATLRWPCWPSRDQPEWRNGRRATQDPSPQAPPPAQTTRRSSPLRPVPPVLPAERRAPSAFGTLPARFCSGLGMPEWRNGRRAGLKIPCPQGREGSTPSSGTNNSARARNLDANLGATRVQLTKPGFPSVAWTPWSGRWSIRRPRTQTRIPPTPSAL